MFERFRERSRELERLDTGDYTPAEYARWQREMRLIHGVLGEKSALTKSLITDIRASDASSVSIVDVGAGSGGVLKIIRDLLTDKELLLTAVEMNDAALATIRNESDETRIAPVAADGLRLPFADDAFDYAISTLTLHHLSDENAEGLIREMDRVSRKTFYVVDLNRHPLGYYAFRAFAPILLQRFTREDGALSILRSFTPAEMLDVARKAGVKHPVVQHSRANRLILSGR